MDYIAKYRFARITPRKAGLVVALVRGRSLNEAYTLLRMTKKRGAVFVHKLLDSAQHNAVDRNTKLDPDRLYVKEIVVGKGPTLKRFHPRAKGRGCPVLKRTSHFRVVLGEREGAPDLRRKRARPVAGKAQQAATVAPESSKERGSERGVHGSKG